MMLRLPIGGKLVGIGRMGVVMSITFIAKPI